MATMKLPSLFRRGEVAKTKPSGPLASTAEPETITISARCSKTRRLFQMSGLVRDGKAHIVKVQSVREPSPGEAAEAEIKKPKSFRGAMELPEELRSCPRCGDRIFVHCYSCSGYSCYPSKSPLADTVTFDTPHVCPHCGSKSSRAQRASTFKMTDAGTGKDDLALGGPAKKLIGKG